jgi:predicted ATPase
MVKDMMSDLQSEAARTLRLRRIRIRGFKALADVDLHVPSDILILIGGNGSGKSSVLRALAFVQYVAKGQPSNFFSDRGWEPTDIRTRIKTPLGQGIISYRILLRDQEDREIYWYFWWHLADARVVHEEVWVRRNGQADPVRVLRMTAERSIEIGGAEIKGIRPEGSLLGLLDPDSIPSDTYETLAALNRWATGIFSLELLSPIEMRKGVRGTPSDIGPRGERLGAFLASLSPEKKSSLVARLKEFYPIEGLDTTRKRAGWVDLRVAERFGEVGRVAAAHMSDGFMRLLGLACIPEFSATASTVLLDEVEDGIEPHILPNFIHMISRQSNVQLILTSHSPMLVNSFEPTQIIFVARDNQGGAKVAPLSALQGFLSGLEFFGPGELWTMMEMSAINRWVLEARPTAQDSEPRPRRKALEEVKNFMEIG